MQFIINFFQHYAATYDAYLHSAIIYQTLAVYAVWMTLVITYMVKVSKSFKYFLPILFASITASSCVYTYTFWSLW